MKTGRLLALILTVAVALGAAAKKQGKEPVVMTINGVDVPLSEFEYLYHKNADQQVNPQSLDEYVKMYVTYKLKVADAVAQGLDTLPEFRKEFDTYRREFAAPYLTDTVMADSMARAAYSHYSVNVDVSHIMRPLDEPTTLLDSLRTLLDNGADFASLARQYSTDPSARQTGGRFGYLRAGVVPYSFEDVAWNTPIGQVSAPFDTQVGHHIIKVNQRRDASGEVHVRHLLLLTQGMDSVQKAERLRTIDSLRTVIANGADFAEIAMLYTEDPSGKQNGGDLPYFGPGRMVPEFEKAAFALKDGELSQPVETSFGYHLILREGSRDLPPYEELLPEIQQHMQIDGRAELPVKRRLDQYRQELGVRPEVSDEELTLQILDLLPQRYPAYRNLINEYRDGLLLFEAANRKVWQGAVADTVGLTKYFEANRDRYQWDAPHYKGMVMMAGNDSLLQAGQEWLKTQPADLTPAQLQAAVRKEFSGTVRLENVLAAKGDNKVVDFLCFDGENPGANGRWKAYAAVRGEIIEQPQTPWDVRGPLVADYQQILQKQWEDELNANAKVKVYNKVLKKVR